MQHVSYSSGNIAICCTYLNSKNDGDGASVLLQHRPRRPRCNSYTSPSGVQVDRRLFVVDVLFELGSFCCHGVDGVRCVEKGRDLGLPSSALKSVRPLTRSSVVSEEQQHDRRTKLQIDLQHSDLPRLYRYKSCESPTAGIYPSATKRSHFLQWTGRSQRRTGCRSPRASLAT